MIAVRGLAIGLGGRTIARDIDFDLADGQRLVVIGPNGSGKSTLLRTLAGLTAPMAGEIIVDGANIAHLRPFERAARLAYMAQEEAPTFPFTIRESVTLGATASGDFRTPRADDEARVAAVLDATDLTHLADRPLDQVSGGERQRAQLARALAQNTPALILDEPTSALDYAHAARLPALLRQSARTVVAAVHDLSLVARLGDFGLLLGGTSPYFAPLDDALHSPRLDEAYGIAFRRVAAPEGLIVAPRTT